MDEAVKLLMIENPAVEPDLAYDIVLFNWNRGVRELDDLACLDQYANAYSEVD